MEKEKHRRQPIEPGAESGKIHKSRVLVMSGR